MSVHDQFVHERARATEFLTWCGNNRWHYVRDSLWWQYPNYYQSADQLYSKYEKERTQCQPQTQS